MFLSLEKRNTISNAINELITEDNQVLKNSDDILLEAENYLYNKDYNMSPLSRLELPTFQSY